VEVRGWLVVMGFLLVYLVYFLLLIFSCFLSKEKGKNERRRVGCERISTRYLGTYLGTPDVSVHL
jgi:hypothetical protein